MTVSVVEVKSSTVTTTASPTVTFTTTPAAGDVVIVAVVASNTFAFSATPATGLGATWTVAYLPTGSAGSYQFGFLIGTGATTSGTVTVSLTASRTCTADARLVRGLTSTTVVGVQNYTTSATSSTGTSQTADSGQIVVGAVRVGETTAGRITSPSSGSLPSQAAWTGQTVRTNSFLGTANTAHAIPSASGSHALAASTSATAVDFAIAQIMVGTAAGGGGSTTGTVSATAPAAVASIAGTVTTTGTVNASAPAAVAAITGTVPGAPTTGTVNAVAPAAVASITGDVAPPSGTITGTVTASAPAAVASVQGATGDPYPESMTFGIGIGLRIEQRTTNPVDPRTNRVPVRLVVVNQSGAVITELDRVEMDTLEEPLKDDDKFSFTLSTSDPKAIHAMPRNGHRMPEVQLWRGSVLMSWLVVLPNPQQSDDGSRITFQCADVSWYFSQLSIDRRPRLDLLRNGDFATGNIDWWVAPNSRLLPVFQTWSVIDVPEARSGKGVRLTGMGSALSKGYIRQRRRFTQPVAARYAMPVVVSGRVRLSPDAVLRDDGWVLHVLVHNTINNAVVLDDDTLSYEQKVKTFNDKYALDRFHDVSVEVEVPANGIEHLVEVRLYSPKTGYADFVDFEMVPAEEFAYFNLDQGHIFKHLIEFAQLADYGKDDLNIIGRTRRTGVYRAESIYKFDEHRSVRSAMDEEMSKYRGADWDVHFYPGEGIRQAAISFPRMGGASGMMFELGGHMVGYKVIGGPLSNSVVVQGLSLSGAARKEAYAIDPGKLGGMVLESTFTAEDGTPVRDLQDVADYALRSYGVPVPSLRVQMNPRSTSELIDRVGKGDVVRVVIHDGLTNVDGNYRIVRRYFDPNTDTLEYDLAQEV